jgi:hypothetical protein
MLLSADTPMPEAGIEPTCSAQATTGLQSAADPFGLSGAVGHSHLQAVRQIERAGIPTPCVGTARSSENPCRCYSFGIFGEREQPLPQNQSCRLRRS